MVSRRSTRSGMLWPFAKAALQRGCADSASLRSAHVRPTEPTKQSRSMKTLNSSPAVGFDQPFEMLEACHERVERSLGLLLRLAEHLVSHGADEQARDAARDVLRYFDLAAPHLLISI